MGSPVGLEDQGRHRGRFSHPLSPGSLLGCQAWSPAFWSPLWPGGFHGHRREGGGEKKKRGQYGGAFQDWRIVGNVPSISPAHSGTVNLLRSWTWSSTLQGQRHSWAPPAVLRLSPTSHPPRVFSGPVGLKHRPCPLPNPCLWLSLASHSQGLFWLFFSPLFYYCGSVLPSGCCFICIYIFYSF